ncbi:DAK2 domain-containing protein [Alkalicoccobacillus porphyridii]|nr:DAK2 domain-containing protein [Alkalicoccobacillus porphyridii]
MPEITAELVERWIKNCVQKLKQDEEYLSTLDHYVGDGDHGQNVIGAFRQLESNWPNEVTSLGSIFNYVGSVLQKETESAAVHLYGEAFLEMSKELHGNDVTIKQFGAGLQTAVVKMKQIGDTKRGDKTLIDVWASVADAVEKQTHPNYLVFEDAAKSALKTSKYLTAQKGEAAKRGNKSIGFLDPGVVSSYYLFQALTNVLTEAEKDSIKN